MSAQEADIAVVHAAFAAMGSRDMGALERLMHPEGEFHSAVMAVEGAVYHGRSGMADFLGDLEAALEDFRVDEPEVRVAPRPGVYVALYRISARGRGSGVRVDLALTMVIRIDEGLLRYGRAYLDQAEGLAAAGLER